MKNKFDKRLPHCIPHPYILQLLQACETLSGLLCLSLYKDMGMGYAMGYAASCSTC